MKSIYNSFNFIVGYVPKLGLLTQKLITYYNILVYSLICQKIYVILKIYSYLIYDGAVDTIDYLVSSTVYTNKYCLQTLWFISHLITLYGSGLLITELLNHKSWNAIKFNVSIIASMLTYSIITFRNLSLTVANKPSKLNVPKLPISAIINSENTYLLATAVIAFYSQQNIFKLVPFTLYSLLNIYITLTEDFFEEKSISKILLPYSDIIQQSIWIVTTIAETILFWIYSYEYLAYNEYAIFAYAFIMLLRLESSEYIRLSLHVSLKIIHTCLVAINHISSLISFEKQANIIRQLIPLSSNIYLTTSSAKVDKSDRDIATA